MNLGRIKVILTIIVILAAFLRFYQLGNNPPSLTWDETAWGYNAYSLGIDGKDEFGRFLPFDYLESFGDFKPPMYAYLDIIPIKIFGLNEFAVRFPSAFFGVLTVLVTYFLTKRIFPDSKSETPVIAAAILAISPWHINLSRAAFEANAATFFIVLGIYLFLSFTRGAATNPPRGWDRIDTSGIFLILSVISFVLSVYTFNTARVVSPILLLILAIGFWRNILQRKKEVTVAIVVGVILMLPILSFLFTPQATLRFREVNIFSDPKLIEIANQEIVNDRNKWWSKIIHNRRLAYTVEYFRHYFDNLSPSFLFIKGDGNPKFSTQDVGQMYLWDLPFFIIGIFLIFRKKEGNWWLIPVWLMVGIIPAATARETPHALRIETTLPTFQILVAYGLVSFLKGISNIKYLILSLFLIFNFLYYYHGYYAHYKREFAGEWQYGYKDSIEYVKSVQGRLDKIYITSDLGRPYIYYLFYTKTDPRIFRENSTVSRDAFGFVTVNGFGKYRFLNSTTKIKINTGRNLFIDTPKNVPAKANILKTFYLLNNSISLVAYE